MHLQSESVFQPAIVFRGCMSFLCSFLGHWNHKGTLLAHKPLEPIWTWTVVGGPFFVGGKPIPMPVADFFGGEVTVTYFNSYLGNPP